MPYRPRTSSTPRSTRGELTPMATGRRAHAARILRRSLGVAVCIALSASVGGCSGHLNQSDELLGSQLPDLAGPMPGTATPSSGPSLTPSSLDRSGWTKTVVRLERRQTESFPAYTRERLYDRTTARERGDWPTPASVLETNSASGMAAVEGLAAPVAFAYDIVAMPIRLFITPPLTPVRTPQSTASLSPSVAQGSS